MEIRILKYFLVTAREENITKASKILHITQPTLSRQLMQLEEELGVTLFIRGKRSLSLTEDGILLRQRAEKIITLVEKTEHSFNEQSKLNSGTVSIGCTETIAASVIPDLIKRFNKTFPQISYDLFCGNSDEIKLRLDNGIIDIGFIREPINTEKYSHMQIFKSDNWGVLVPYSDNLSKETIVSFNKLSSKPLILPSRPSLKDEIEELFKESDTKMNILATYNALSSAIVLTQNNVGLTICPQSAIQLADHSLVTFIPFTPTYNTRCIVIWKKRQIFTSAAAKFLQFVNNAYKA